LTRPRPEWEICGGAANGEQAVGAVEQIPPDVVILDISMPGMGKLEAASRIAKMGLGCRTLIFTMHESDRLDADIREIGAHGYVQKSQAARDLVVATERVLQGETFLSQRGS
jgi:two-component system invasion response regulator UvrY